MGSKTLRLSAIGAILISAVLLIGFIVGAIDSEQLKSTLVKVLAVIGVLALASIAATALGSGKK